MTLRSLIDKILGRTEPAPTHEQAAAADAREMQLDAMNEEVAKRESGEPGGDRYTPNP